MAGTVNYIEVYEIIEMLSAMAKRGDEQAAEECERILEARKAWREEQTPELWAEFFAAAERASAWLTENR
jgi:hypothetical protein